MYSLHPQLLADTLPLGNFPLCECRLMNDMHYPWLILVPKRPELKEIFQLNVKDQQQLIRESSYVASRLTQHFNADKINIGALGNMVPQLHLHHIARYQNDATWPGPVWGRHQAWPYASPYLEQLLERLQQAFADCEKIGFQWAEGVLPVPKPEGAEVVETAVAEAVAVTEGSEAIPAADVPVVADVPAGEAAATVDTEAAQLPLLQPAEDSAAVSPAAAESEKAARPPRNRRSRHPANRQRREPTAPAEAAVTAAETVVVAVEDLPHDADHIFDEDDDIGNRIDGGERRGGSASAAGEADKANRRPRSRRPRRPANRQKPVNTPSS